jgi:IS1 family transposase
MYISLAQRKRQDKDFPVLWKLLEVFPISLYHTNNWSSYSKYVPSNRHLIGKDRTWKNRKKESLLQNTHKAIKAKNDIFLER